MKNPISFDVYGQVDAADVAVAAEQLSYEILSCSEPFCRTTESTPLDSSQKTQDLVLFDNADE